MLENIARIHNPRDTINGFCKNRNAGKGGGEYFLKHIAQALFGIKRKDIHARRHHVFRHNVVKLK